MKALCRCCSGKNYAECCQPFHQGTLPKTALELMRSRYTAYALGDADYIIKTTHKDNPEFRQSGRLQKQQILSFSHNTQFNGLEILDVQEGEFTDFKGTVTFHVTLSQNNLDASYTEKSDFKKEHGAWLYLKGEMESSQ